MDKELQDLFFGMPPDTDYADGMLSELDDEHIPQERIPKFVQLLTDSNPSIAFDAARVLCSWGDERGFAYLRDFVLCVPPINEEWNPHRLRNYDDTYRLAMLSFQDYWARRATRSKQEGEAARKALLSPILQIIGLSNSMPFAINCFFHFISDYGFIEYIPALKAHLQAIIKEPEKHHWKVADCAHLLMKFDPDFVQATLAAHGKTLVDFPNK